MDLGLDIGFGEVKAVLRNGDNISDFVFPSVYAGYTPSPMDEAGTGASIVDSGGRKYVVGADAKREKNQISPADLGDIIEAMEVYIAYLRRISGVNDTANVVAGVPPCYWKQKEDYRIRLSAMFGKVAVVPQGLGAARVVLDDLSPGSRHIILDFGYNTVDHLIVEVSENKEKNIVVRRGGTWRSCGVTLLTDMFRGELGDAGLKGLRFHVLKEFLRNGQANFHGEIIDLSGAKRRAGKQYLLSIGSRIKDELGGELDHIDGIIAAGGGIYYLDVVDLFKNLPVIIPENPELANAMGQMLLAQ